MEQMDKMKVGTESDLDPCAVSGTRGGERWRRQKLLLVAIFESRRLFILLKTRSNTSRRKIDRSVKLLLNSSTVGHLILRRHDMGLRHRDIHKPRLMNHPLATGFAVQCSCHVGLHVSCSVRTNRRTDEREDRQTDRQTDRQLRRN
jgi:hypothetical protein